jgi:hypothetical protein
MASAHMLMSSPPGLRFKDNPNVGSLADYNMVAPLNADGSNFPCKGYQSDLGTPAGKSVADWAAGSSQSFTITGGASHMGGSCQAALSYDKGKTFTVIHSFIGDCPTGGSFKFAVPSDAPAGAALFAWTWFNNVGNREMYMNCASITITGSSGVKRAAKRAGTSFTSRPSLFVANLGNGCTTKETTDVKFPDPGPDVTNVSKSPGDVVGTCKAVNGIGGGSAANPAGAAPSAPGAPSSGTASASLPGGVFATAASSASAPSGTASGALPLASDGSCGGNFGCQGSPHGGCCSKFGFCGKSDAHCGAGCQSAFGTCATNGQSTGSSPALKISTDQTCGPTTTNTCQGSTFGNCCSKFGYCGSTSEFCGTGCQAGFGACGLSSGSASAALSSGSVSAAVSSGSASAAIVQVSQDSNPASTYFVTVTYHRTLTKTVTDPSTSTGFNSPTSTAPAATTVRKTLYSHKSLINPTANTNTGKASQGFVGVTQATNMPSFTTIITKSPASGVQIIPITTKPHKFRR